MGSRTELRRSMGWKGPRFGGTGVGAGSHGLVSVLVTRVCGFREEDFGRRWSRRVPSRSDPSRPVDSRRSPETTYDCPRRSVHPGRSLVSLGGRG